MERSMARWIELKSIPDGRQKREGHIVNLDAVALIESDGHGHAILRFSDNLFVIVGEEPQEVLQKARDNAHRT